MIGLCQCGCGDPAPIAKFTKVSRGFRKGEPQRYIQSGRAVGAGAFPRPADALFDTNFAAPSEFNYRTINFFECETTWKYTYLFTLEPFAGQITGLGAAVIAKLAQRPVNPRFY